MKDRLEPWWFVYNTMFSTYIIDRVNINISTDHRLPASDNVTHDADLTPISAYMAWEKVRKRGGNMTLQFYVMPFVSPLTVADFLLFLTSTRLVLALLKPLSVQT